MISFLDSYLSLAKIQEIRLQAWTLHALVEARYFKTVTTDTLADARRARRERKKNK
jgi:hypothetical protein